MKVQKIYEISKAFMFEKTSSTVYNDYIIPIINKILTETFEENNMLRMFKYLDGDDSKLPFVDGISNHLVSSLDDEVDFEEEYCLDVIPKGIDANFLMDDDLGKKPIYDTEYNNARVAHQVCISSDRVKELKEKARAI